jgi:hypothetical protein
MRVDIGEVAGVQLEDIRKDLEAYSSQGCAKFLTRLYKRLKQIGQFPLSGESIPQTRISAVAAYFG